jgi:hypothetical protein
MTYSLKGTGINPYTNGGTLMNFSHGSVSANPIWTKGD